MIAIGVLTSVLLGACTKDDSFDTTPAGPVEPAEMTGEVIVKFAPYVSDILDSVGAATTRCGAPATRSGILSVDEVLDLLGGCEVERIFPVDARCEERTRPTAILTLAGEVIPSTRPTYAYPHAKGSLLLKHDEVAFAASRRGVESIECLNGGDDTLRISVDTLLLPPCVRAEFVPAVLAPGGVGELTVRFDPSAGRAPRHLPVMLRGLGLPPAQGSVTVRIAPEEELELDENKN